METSMKTLILAAAGLLAAGAAAAQPAAAPVLPRAFDGYSQPDITPGLCRNVSPQETQCIIPQSTAGLYQITATGTSTATAAGAIQKVVINVGGLNCMQAQTGANAGWAAGSKKTLSASCTANVLTDQTLTVSALYFDQGATKDPKGPTLSIKRLPWPGALSVQTGAAAQQ
jgi:hypothetical protein